MPKNCLICKKNRDCSVERISYHQFPPDETLRKKWMDSLKLTSIGKGDIICGDHFSADSFYQNCGIGQRLRLKAHAIPHLKTDETPNYVVNTISSSSSVSDSDNHNPAFVLSIQNDDDDDDDDEYTNVEYLDDDFSGSNDLENDVMNNENILSISLKPTNKINSSDETIHHSLNSKRYRVNTRYGPGYLSAKDFATPEAWNLFQEHQMFQKRAKDAARMKKNRAEHSKQKMRLLLKHLKDQRNAAVASYLQVEKKSIFQNSSHN